MIGVARKILHEHETVPAKQIQVGGAYWLVEADRRRDGGWPATALSAKERRGAQVLRHAQVAGLMEAKRSTAGTAGEASSKPILHWRDEQLLRFANDTDQVWCS